MAMSKMVREVRLCGRAWTCEPDKNPFAVVYKFLRFLGSLCQERSEAFGAPAELKVTEHEVREGGRSFIQSSSTFASSVDKVESPGGRRIVVGDEREGRLHLRWVRVEGKQKWVQTTLLGLSMFRTLRSISANSFMKSREDGSVSIDEIQSSSRFLNLNGDELAESQAPTPGKLSHSLLSGNAGRVFISLAPKGNGFL
jgi:hypothetical protein